MVHFSKYIRPKAKVIGVDKTDADLLVTAAQNPDNSIAVVVFNEGSIAKQFNLHLKNRIIDITINAQAIQTILISQP
jgi:glucosylceramidase